MAEFLSPPFVIGFSLLSSLFPSSLIFALFIPRRTRLIFAAHVQVSKNGWAEGECKGKAGWFPSNYVEKRERVLASKVAEVF